MVIAAHKKIPEYSGANGAAEFGFNDQRVRSWIGTMIRNEKRSLDSEAEHESSEDFENFEGVKKSVVSSRAEKPPKKNRFNFRKTTINRDVSYSKSPDVNSGSDVEHLFKKNPSNSEKDSSADFQNRKPFQTSITLKVGSSAKQLLSECHSDELKTFQHHLQAIFDEKLIPENEVLKLDISIKAHLITHPHLPLPQADSPTYTKTRFNGPKTKLLNRSSLSDDSDADTDQSDLSGSHSIKHKSQSTHSFKSNHLSDHPPEKPKSKSVLKKIKKEI